VTQAADDRERSRRAKLPQDRDHDNSIGQRPSD
jgi:hypothetical protein